MPPVPAPAVFASLKHALTPHEPYAAMDEQDVDRLLRASRLQYFATGETVITPATERPAHCYVIRQGAIRGERPGVDGEANALWELAAGEMFPLSALLARRGVTSVYRATKDSFCLAFPAAVFDDLCRSIHQGIPRTTAAHLRFAPASPAHSEERHGPQPPTGPARFV